MATSGIKHPNCILALADNQTPRPRRPNWFYFPSLRYCLGLIQQYSGLPLDAAQQVTMWEASTWVSDQLSCPSALIVVGPNMRRAVDLFQLLACGSRRALTLTGINRAALVGLPTDLNLTLLIGQPDLSRNLSQLLTAANYRGVHVPGTRGGIQDWAGAKAIFLGSTGNRGMVRL